MNPNCAETYACFRILGDELDPEEVTKLLKVLPTECVRRGHPVRSLHGKREVRSRTGRWELSTQGSTNSTELEEHLVLLLSKIEPVSERIRLIRVPVRVEFHCFWMSGTGQGGPVLSAKTLGRISRLGADLDFDLYFAE
jgi:hypothetical protein